MRPISSPIPTDEKQIAALFDWAGGKGAALIPYGGGSSVVGGVDAGCRRRLYTGTVTVDMSRLNKVLEVDPVSRAARSRAARAGPNSKHSSSRMA